MQNCHEQIREFGDSLFVNLSLSLLFVCVLFYERWYFIRSYVDIRIRIYIYIYKYVAASRHGLTAFSRPHHPASLHLVTYILAFSLLLYYFYQFLLLSSAYLCSSYFLLLFVLFCQPFSDRPFLSLFLATFAIFLSYLWFLRLFCLFSLCTFHISVRDRN